MDYSSLFVWCAAFVLNVVNEMWTFLFKQYLILRFALQASNVHQDSLRLKWTW